MGKQYNRVMLGRGGQFAVLFPQLYADFIKKVIFFAFFLPHSHVLRV